MMQVDFQKLLLPLMLVFTISGEASSAIVTFDGRFTSGGPGILGSIPFPDPVQSFSVAIDFTEGTGFTTISAGSFTTSNLTFNVVGGSIFVNENGISDDAQFLIDISGPATGILDLRLIGDAITTSLIDAPNLSSLLSNNTLNPSITANFAGGGTYSGTVSAVPEPGSGIACLAAAGLGIYRRGRRVQS